MMMMTMMMAIFLVLPLCENTSFTWWIRNSAKKRSNQANRHAVYSRFSSPLSVSKLTSDRLRFCPRIFNLLAAASLLGASVLTEARNKPRRSVIDHSIMADHHSGWPTASCAVYKTTSWWLRHDLEWDRPVIKLEVLTLKYKDCARESNQQKAALDIVFYLAVRQKRR